MLKDTIETIKDKALDAIKFSGIAFLISFFGAFAGSEGTSKDWRRLGIPIVFMLCGLYSLRSIYVLCLLLQNIVFRIGHGIPSE